MQVTYYPGCSLEGTAIDYAASIGAVAGLLDLTLTELEDWNCCGATAAHSVSHQLSLALPALSLDHDRPHLTFFEPVMHEDLALACDLAVLAEDYRAAPETAALTELLRLHPGPLGFFQSDNVRNLPVITNRRGIYVAGPGRAVMDLDQAFGEADAAVTEVQELLGQGAAMAPKGRAAIDRGRCVLCLTCHRLCPHGAVTWTTGPSSMNWPARVAGSAPPSVPTKPSRSATLPTIRW